ncbi:DNA repair helicase [Cucurbitaria berberidis CBS 394.84]|uniref:ATP-dependent DNA helicase CHL1 n=1 Tax=Cucurbitaria berberidis CBS 394.84 TaxID=1168544 RepID=A0A9P4GKU9_9PLEO|nr:DNA repair helicase [Cucurbitaria berberidis CBS 394.84]KAF1848188.1 DNA repair helicase [Cucurbitaria berberidis CBS 394.84]
MDDDHHARDFHHPYEPYEIQKEFMNAVYDCLEDGKVGIFESPTGTGKSLSLICGSLTWLRHHKRRTFEEGFAIDAASSDEPAWIIEHAQKQRKQEALRRRQELNDRIAKIKAKEKRTKARYENGEPSSKRRKVAPGEADGDDGEAQFALDDYESDTESNKRALTGTFNDSGLSTETQALMEKLGFAVGESRDEGEVPDETKIFFCSRTHSQLTQFANELGRVKIPPAITPESHVDDSYEDDLVEDVKHLTLGSRKNLCINSKVNRLGSATAINERCLELQQSTSAEGRCPHMATKENELLIAEFRDHALAKIRDIEDLGSLGKKLGVCPYYASRPATKYCEIVTLPYPLLLQRTAREALGLSLKDHVIIIDEAHNLMDAIAGIYSVSVTLEQVQQSRAQLAVYLQKFRNKLKGKNRVYVAQTVRILDSIIGYLQSIDGTAKVADGLVDMASIMSGKGVDQINIFKLNTYLQESRLARKVDGYTAYSSQVSAENGSNNPKSATKQGPRHTVPVLMHVQAFLLSLMNPSAEGRFFYSKEDGSSITLRYMLLDPTFHFRDIVEDARAVVLAGGTMSPMSDYEQHLLSYLSPSKITTLSCGHVIPTSNLLAVPVVKTSSAVDFDFTFESRNKEKTITDLGLGMLTFAQHIPDGLVVFFPSYAYLDTCIAAWKRLSPPSSNLTFWDSFTQTKPVFLEQRSQQLPSGQASSSKEAAVDSVLMAYSAAVASGNGRGALLFAVIGGTLSEGINFSDALGRGVVVVGLPFPNPHSAEWKAKMQYISSKEAQNGGDGKAAAREYYENACMRAVNQCVGRAIRHKGDYAAILMLDRRYGSKRIQDKLPKWIRGSLVDGAGVQEVGGRLTSEERGVYTTVAQTEGSSAGLTAHGKEVLLVNNDDEQEEAKDLDVPVYIGSVPTPEDLLFLPRVADTVPYGAFLVAIVELCERFAYYGLSGPFQNYIANAHDDANGLPGALGLKQARATAMTNFFQFWCYVTPILGAVVADQYLGKYATIKWFSVVYMVGIAILFVTSLPWSIERGAAFPGLIVAMVVIGLGTGGIKSNVSPLVAEQVRSTKPFVKTLRSGKQVIVDPEVTVQRVYMVFYMCINLGSISAIATTMLELHVGFWSAYLLPLLMFCVGYVVLVTGKKRYVIKPPQGGVIGNCFRALWIAARSGGDLDKAKPSSQEHGIGKSKVTWDDAFIEELKTALVACKVFLFFPMYWVTFSQMMNNFVSQAGQMQLHSLPNDILPNLDPITIILLIPIMDRLIYPFIRTRLHFAFTPITRITLGFLFAALAMLYAGILQTVIYAAPPCYSHPLKCAAGMIEGGGGRYKPNELHVAWQAPAYILVALSEILASITGLELAYAKAPANMKSFIMSLFLLTSAGGSALGILLAPLAKDPHQQWLYFGLAIATTGTGCIFWRMFKDVDYGPGKAVQSAEEEYELVERSSADDDGYYSGNENDDRASRVV